MGLSEQIYLLEIQIHDAHFETVKELQCLDNQQDFKIYAHFLSFDPVMVYDNLNEDFKALPILFKMNPDELIKAIDRSPLTLSVAGMLSESREYTVGTIKVLFTETFVEAITMATASVMYPVIAQIDEPFPFRNLYHEETGSLSVVLKLNCFGFIDIKRLSPCENDQVKESFDYAENNVDVDNLEGKEFELNPIITDLDQVSPASKVTKKYEGIPQSIPWKMTVDRPPVIPNETITTQGPVERRSMRNDDSTKPAEFTLQCTCDEIPDFLSKKPVQPVTLKCQCADILAAMKSCFPDGLTTNDQSYGERGETNSQVPPNNTATPTTYPSEMTPPKVQNETAQRTQTVTANKVPPLNSSILQPAATIEEIVPTSAVCGLELKTSIPPYKSSSEDNLHQVNIKPDMKAVMSNAELFSPEGKTEDSSKKFNDKNGSNWDERKQNIKKEFKKKSKHISDIYQYTAGMYPGLVLGHKYCIPSLRLVPRNMGWMWNLLDLFGQSKRSKGWRPGAIVKTVANNFGSWNRAAGFKDGDEAESFFNFKRKKGGKEAETLKSTHAIKPTLHVHKKDKFYHITVNPPGESNVKPLTFKVDPRKGSSDEETSSDSTSDDSFEFEYTVPAGLVPPPKKIEWANETTQYNIQDFSPKKKTEQIVPTDEPPKERKDSKKGKKEGKKKDKGGKKK